MSGNHQNVTVDGLPVKALMHSGASSLVVPEKFHRYLKKGALIDYGRSELTLIDVEVTSEEVVLKPLRLCVMKDCRQPAYSIMKIPVVNHCREDSGNEIVEGSKLLALKKEVFMPLMLVTLRRSKTEIWVVNGQSQEKVIPQGMCVAFAEPCCPNYIATISETSRVSSEISETKQSLEFLKMISPDLDANQKRMLRAHRVSPGDRRIIHDEVGKILDRGIIKPSKSPWSSSVILVRKKDNTWRFCVDYRRLNRITKKNVYPFPRIDDTLDSLQGSEFFSSMDLSSRYWQIEVDEADREKTVFITPEGLYEFNDMPLGLCNAPATVERMMDNLLRHLKWTMCLCYLDDVIVFSETFKDHDQRIRSILKCIQDAGLVLNPKKCVFGSRQIKISGHLVSEEGIMLDPGKIRAVQNFPFPKNIRDARSFLGLCSYYRRFIKDFCLKAQSLQEHLKNDSKFTWGSDHKTNPSRN
ncbi:hypothetical protein TNCV_844131 [Trichonephila clavipes]|nr:hypothetical protein TNCV_844131 [Trichonephila clavipes]